MMETRKRNELSVLGESVLSKTSTEDIIWHYAGVDPNDVETIGKMTHEENSMWARMLKDATWVKIGLG